MCVRIFKRNKNESSAAFCFMLIPHINNMRRVNICSKNDKRIIISVRMFYERLVNLTGKS